MSSRALITIRNMTEEIDISELISLIEQNPVIWDRTQPNYKCKLTRDYAWKEVCHGLIEGFEDMDIDTKTELYKEITKKWRSIKDNFIKYVKKMSEGDPLTARRAKYHHYEQLLFLKKCINSGSGAATAAAPAQSHAYPFNVCLVKDECEDEESKAESSVEAEGDKSPPARRRAKRPRPPSAAPPPTRRRRMGALEAEALRRLREPDNRHLSFIRGILPTLDTFTEQQTLRFQSAVLNIVSQIKFGNKSCDET